MRNAKLPVLSVVLYALAALTGIFTIWTIQAQISNGMTVMEMYLESNPFGENAYTYVSLFVNGSQGLILLVLSTLLIAAAELLRRQAAGGGAVVVEEETEVQAESGGSFFDDDEGAALEPDGDGGPELGELFTDEENDD